MEQRRSFTVKDVQRLAPASVSSNKGAVLEAWERFTRGEDHVRGVRPEVVISWHRCREQYRVDPHLTEAPPAVTRSDHTLEHDVVFTELGGLAASVAHEVENLNGIVTVADATGRVLAAWGDPATLARASDANLAPWASWSERAAGTNGMGTAMEAHTPVLIRGAEHWCRAFHSWVCAGMAIRDVVTGAPIAALNISCWRTPLPDIAAARWLVHAAAKTQKTLKTRARNSAAELTAAFAHAKGRSAVAMAAVDTAGKVVIADERASVLMGVPADTPAVEPATRWVAGLPDLVRIAGYASTRATENPDWIGSTQIFTHLACEPTPISIRPVFLSGHLAGHLIAFGASDGAAVPHTVGPGRSPLRLRRLVALREDRMVLLRLSEVCFAESNGNDIWLSGDQGRLRAASQGLDNLANELADVGFLRVHRRYVVNLSRIREIERGFKGELLLIMDGRSNDVVPVSRRRAPAVRAALAL
ncbi:MAG: LytTR family transcriptional regulator DNA-binding domain-containing protein [Pseudonocardia sp.]|nr:LytTR family transcriptional regulator DNA-binding domain-containing protein [Pseudonocardia sp.]